MLRRRHSKAPFSRDVQEAEAAIRKVNSRDEKVQSSSNEIMSVVRELRDFQRRNNFASAIRHALGGEGG